MAGDLLNRGTGDQVRNTLKGADMGLDMYLSASFYIGSYISDAGGDPDEKRKAIAAQVGLTPADMGDDSPSVTVIVGVGYWRKANAIHGWFVRECQDDVDDCREAHVEREQLEELRSLCARVIAGSELKPGKLHAGTTYAGGTVTENYEDGLVIDDPSLAAELLSPQQGFFFGPSDYNEWYIDDLKNTIAIIDRVLNNPAFKNASFVYRSSW